MFDSKPVTISDLEQVISILKLGRFFSFGQGALNEPHGHWDVFPEVDELEDFDPADEGDANEAARSRACKPRLPRLD